MYFARGDAPCAVPSPMSTLHPATRIAAWMVLAAFIGWLGAPALALASVALAGLLALNRPSPFFRLLYRTRWLLLSLAVLYGLTFPGRLLLPSLGAFSPTVEGIEAGAVQAWRMAVLLAGLALLHAACKRDCLIAGLFRLLWPLRWLGVNVSRVAGRIWLTLEYAENADKWTRAQWHRLLEGELDDAADGGEDRVITVEVGRLGWWDGLTLLALVLAMGGLAQW